jgi:hypothetical protein
MAKISFRFAMLAFIVFASVNSTMIMCNTDDSTLDDDTAGCDCDSTPVQRCRADCDTLYGCGLILPDGQTGTPLSNVECRAGCEKDPGNVDCVDQCVRDYEDGLTCGDLQACVSDGCGIPVQEG